MKVTRSGTPTPDSYFVEQLEGIDKNLSVKWNVHLERWVIWYKSQDGRTYRILEVEDEDGTYRQLDARTIHWLKQHDTHNSDEDPVKRIDRMLEASKMARSKAVHEHREEVKYKARQKASQFLAAAENFYYNGVFSANQLDNKKIISIGAKPSANEQLINKLGAPHLAGTPKIIT